MDYQTLLGKLEGKTVGTEAPLLATIYLRGRVGHMVCRRTTVYSRDAVENALQELTLPEIVEEVSKNVNACEATLTDPLPDLSEPERNRVRKGIAPVLDRERGLYQLLRQMLAEENPPC
ncbi:hypothetical protein HZC30_04295 [Candidatus Woesearchaeota archaeon]|nr:hypothetical protein [Candidatus Woesearchaeota archaeon]